MKTTKTKTKNETIPLTLRRKNREVGSGSSITNRDFVSSLFPEEFIFNLRHVFHVMPYTLDFVTRETRVHDIIHWRQIITVYNFMNGMSLQEVGDEIGKDHATVLHSIRKFVYAMQGFDAPFKNKIDLVIECNEAGVIATRDSSMNEMISAAYLEREMFKKFPILAESLILFYLVIVV